MVKVNRTLVDAWSIPHLIIGYLFGRYTQTDLVQFTAANAGWELFENLILKKYYDVFNIPFGRETVLESKGKSICDFLITEAGYGIGLYQRLMDRPMVDFIASTASHELTGAEIGVYMGHNAENIMKKLPIKKLYLVDPYKSYYQDSRGQAFLPPFIELSKNIAHGKMMPYAGRYEFIELPSDDASKIIPNQLDFVYIDGNHSYNYVRNDILTYYPKIKTGGVIGGHDYINIPDVRRAVDEFAHENNLYVNSKNMDWWILKNIYFSRQEKQLSPL